MADNKDKKVLNVPALRFPEFTEEWESVLLEDVAEFQKKRISSDLLNNSNYISTENILQNFGGVQNSISIPANTNVIEYQRGDVLLSNIRPYLKKVWLSDRHGGCSADVFVLRGNQCERRFLYYVIASDRFINFVMSGAKGVKMPRGDKSQMEKFTFFIPTNVEQKKIAMFLSMLDERIRLQNKIIEDLKKLKSAIVEKLFADRKGEYVKLGNIASITNGNGDVQDARTDYHEWLFPFFDRSEEQKFFDTYSFDKEAIIYAGEGQSFMPRYYNGKFALHQRCYAITDFADIIVPQYCYHYMKTLNSYFIRNAVGSTVPSLRIDTFQKAPILLLEKETQYKICDCLNCLDNIYNTEMRLLLVLMQQKQYLLQSMFI